MQRAALLALLLVFAGCQAPATQVASETPSGPTPAPQVGIEQPAGPAPDPPRDVLGWENGRWYDESLSLTPGDGLNDTELDALVARSMARVERVRQLEFETSVSVSVISRAEYRNRSGGGGSTPAALRRFDNAKFEALFLVGESEGSIERQSDTRSQSVLGYYSPSRDAIVIVAPSATPTLDGEGTLAHELVHALQDQHFDVEPVARRTRDAVQGRSGIVEGDATYVGHEYRERCRESWDCLSEHDGSAAGSGDGGDDASGGDDGGSNDASDGGGAHFGIQYMLYFPYSDGPGLIAQLRDSGGWPAVNRAYADVPDGSTEVVDPERYPRWKPARVRLPDRSASDWQRVRPPGRPAYGVPGQSAIASSLAYTLADDYNDTAVVDAREVINYRENGSLARSDPFDYAPAGADGWAGGRLHVYRRGEDLGYAWRTRWTNASEASEFARVWGALVSHWGGERVARSGAGGVYVVADGPFADAVRITQSGDTVTVVNAPTRGSLDGVHDA